MQSRALIKLDENGGGANVGGKQPFFKGVSAFVWQRRERKKYFPLPEKFSIASMGTEDAVKWKAID